MARLERELRVIERRQNVRNNGLFVDVDAEHLSLLVDTDDTVGRLVLGSDEDGFARDAVHVNAGSGFQVVQVDEAVLGDHVDDIVFLGERQR